MEAKMENNMTQTQEELKEELYDTKNKLEKMQNKNLNFLWCNALNHVGEAAMYLWEYKHNLTEYRGQEEIDKYWGKVLKKIDLFATQLERMRHYLDNH